MVSIARFMTSVLMILVCLFGYLCVIIGTIFVLKVGMKEIFGIEILTRWKR